MALRQTRFFVSSVITHVCSACSWRGKVDSAATMHRRNLNTVFSFMMTLLSIMIHAHASLFSFPRPDILPQPPDQKYAKGRDASRRTRLSLELKTKCPESFDTLLAPRVALRGGATDSRDIMSKQQRSWAGPPHCVKVCSLFALSYAFSVGFNINNKRASLLAPLPWTYASLNLLIGATVALASWSANVAPWPRIRLQDVGVLVPIGLLHAVSHLTVVLGLGAGSVSFIHTVKASEACFTALLSFLLLRQKLPLPVYLTLVPVVVGVGITSCNQIRFSWLALLSALVSNLSNALRNVLVVKNIGPAAGVKVHGKNGIVRGLDSGSSSSNSSKSDGKSLTAVNTGNVPSRTTTPVARGNRESGFVDLAPGNTYRLTTVVGAILLFPMAAFLERGSWPKLWQGATEAVSSALKRVSPFRAALEEDDRVTTGTSEIWVAAFRHAVLSGVCFNLFYDLSFRLLGQLHPVTHAVGNTVKRIVVIGAGAAAFGGDLGGRRGATGSALAVVGVLAYSLAKARCKGSIAGGGGG